MIEMAGPAELGVLGVRLHPLFFGGERPKNHLDIALSVAAIHGAPPDFCTCRQPCKVINPNQTDV